MTEVPQRRRSPVSERLMGDLTRRISSREFPAGSMLPSIRNLATHYGASPRTMEAALHRLCGQGTLERIPNRGFKVLATAETANRKIAILHQAHGILDPRPEVTQAVCERLDHYGLEWDLFDLRIRQPEPEFLKRNYAAAIFSRQLYGEEYVTALEQCGLPLVVASWEGGKLSPASFVDRGALIRSTVRLLYDMGHREIALIVRHTDRYFYPALLNNYHAILAELGLPDRPESILVMQHDFELGSYLTGRELLQRPVRPTAVIVCRDYQACGLYQACLEQGLEFGRDLSVVGYDDIGWPQGRELLTTYVEPCRELGQTAADILHDLLCGDRSNLRREVHPVLQMRRSLSPR